MEDGKAVECGRIGQLLGGTSGTPYQTALIDLWSVPQHGIRSPTGDVRVPWTSVRGFSVFLVFRATPSPHQSVTCPPPRPPLRSGMAFGQSLNSRLLWWGATLFAPCLELARREPRPTLPNPQYRALKRPATLKSRPAAQHPRNKVRRAA